MPFGLARPQCQAKSLPQLHVGQHRSSDANRLCCAVSAKSAEIPRQHGRTSIPTDSAVRVRPPQPRSRSRRCAEHAGPGQPASEVSAPSKNAENSERWPPICLSPISTRTAITATSQTNGQPIATSCRRPVEDEIHLVVVLKIQLRCRLQSGGVLDNQAIKIDFRGGGNYWFMRQCF